jgi:hypothetical protein
MNATAAASPQEPWQFVGMTDGNATYETGPGAVDEEIPPSPGEIVRALNAARPHPRPLCRQCNWPIEPSEAGALWPRTCCHCDVNETYRLLNRLVRIYGKRMARAKLIALCRVEPCKPIGPVPFKAPAPEVAAAK